MGSGQRSKLTTVVRLLGVTLGSGLLAGVALDVLTFVVARYGPQGDDWSFRGNGALVVPFGLGSAVLAGAWAASVLHYRSAARWLALGIGAGVIGTLFIVISVAFLVLFGSAGLLLSIIMTLVTPVWMLAAPVLAGVLPVARKPAQRVLGVHIVAGVVFLVALAAGLIIAGIVLPPGS